MKILDLYSTDYEMGLTFGKAFRSFLKKKAEKTAGEVRERRKEIKEIKTLLKEKYPMIYEEIRGRAKGAEVSTNAMIYLLSPEFTFKKDGCTTVMMTDRDGDVLFSHNEDESAFTNANTALVTYHYKDHWVMGYLAADKLLGSCFGVNSHGLVFSSNFLASDNTDTSKISRYILQRHLMDATDMKDFEKRIKEVETASMFSMNVVDVRRKKACNFEKDSSHVYKTVVKDRFARANHFLKKKGTVKMSGSSSFRSAQSQKMIAKLDRDTVTLKKLERILNYQGKDLLTSIHLAPKKRGVQKTVANFSFSTKDGIMVINDYLGNKEYRFRYEEGGLKRIK